MKSKTNRQTWKIFKCEPTGKKLDKLEDFQRNGFDKLHRGIERSFVSRQTLACRELKATQKSLFAKTLNFPQLCCCYRAFRLLLFSFRSINWPSEELAQGDVGNCLVHFITRLIIGRTYGGKTRFKHEHVFFRLTRHKLQLIYQTLVVLGNWNWNSLTSVGLRKERNAITELEKRLNHVVFTF